LLSGEKNKMLSKREKLTYTPIFMEAVAKALKDFPGLNISVDGDYIIKRKILIWVWRHHC
jgi:2-oxoglutarate dehydrogenase E2 component (dihydrolipoamide succinyltransferase)